MLRSGFNSTLAEFMKEDELRSEDSEHRAYIIGTS